MGPITIVFGVLLAALGGGLYYYSPTRSPTALIPAYFGIALIFLGTIALSDRIRKHAMHVAALVGLVGFAIPAYRVIKTYVEQGSDFEFNLAIGGQVAMSALCLVFLGLCIKSFIDARSARKQQAAQTPGPPA